jgi:hypothetical protein
MTLRFKMTHNADGGVQFKQTVTIEEVVASLTSAHAAEYAGMQDKLVWVQTTLLDPNDLPRRIAYSDMIEDRLDELSHWKG